jgi:hypothetical protein
MDLLKQVGWLYETTTMLVPKMMMGIANWKIWFYDFFFMQRKPLICMRQGSNSLRN